MKDVVRVTYVLPNATDFPGCWPTLRKYFGKIKPAAMMLSAGLSDPRMRIEIEVTARHVTGSYFYTNNSTLTDSFYPSIG